MLSKQPPELVLLVRNSLRNNQYLKIVNYTRPLSISSKLSLSMSSKRDKRDEFMNLIMDSSLS